MKKRLLGWISALLITFGAFFSLGCAGNECKSCGILYCSHCVGDSLGDTVGCAVEGMGATNACYSDCGWVTCWYCGKENYVQFCVDAPVYCGSQVRNGACADCILTLDCLDLITKDYEYVVGSEYMSYTYNLVNTTKVANSLDFYKYTFEIIFTPKEKAWADVRAEICIKGGANSTVGYKYLGFCEPGMTIKKYITVTFKGLVVPIITEIDFRGNTVKK